MTELHLLSNDVAAATSTAETIPTPAERAFALRRVALAHARAGNVRAADRLYQRARDASPPETPAERVYAAVAEAREAVGRGDRAGAARTLAAAERATESAGSPEEMATLVMELAEAHAAVGDLAECRRLLARAEAAVASEGDEAGYISMDEVQRRRGALRAGFTVAFLKSSLAGAVAAAGDLAWATEIAESLPEDDRSSTYFLMVNRLITRGDLDTAERIAREKVTKDHSKPLVARSIARAHSGRGATDRARAWVESLATPVERAHAMIGAAEGLAGKSFDDLGD
jgi:hypothetical protein